MTTVFINVADYGSTGAIVKKMHDAALAEGDVSVCYFGRVRGNIDGEKKVGNKVGFYWHVLRARLGQNGHGSALSTEKLCRELLELKPDRVVLHNIHGYYLHIGKLFETLRKLSHTRVFWYLHDCWAFTGGCAYYSMNGCEKWKEGGCGNCTKPKGTYPEFLIDRTAKEFSFKKELFTSIPPERMTLIVPSLWLKSQVEQSFLSSYPVIFSPNRPDPAVFYPRTPAETEAAARKYGISSRKTTVLGAAADWSPRKQPEIMTELASLLPECQVVCIGMKKKLLRKLPDNVKGFPCTDSPDDLAALYTLADVLVNPSLEDNCPMVPLEAQMCGTPVVSSDLCGNPETVTNGEIVKEARSAPAYAEAIRRVLEKSRQERAQRIAGEQEAGED